MVLGVKNNRSNSYQLQCTILYNGIGASKAFIWTIDLIMKYLIKPMAKIGHCASGLANHAFYDGLIGLGHIPYMLKLPPTEGQHWVLRHHLD